MTYYHLPAHDVPIITALNCCQMDPSSEVSLRITQRRLGMQASCTLALRKAMQNGRQTSNLCPWQTAQSFSSITTKASQSECTVTSGKP